MIRSIKIADENGLGYKPPVTEMEFQPGINILVGQNSCGKSSIINALALWFMCQRGGRTLVGTFDKRKRNGFEIDHDGSPVVYHCPTNEVGLMGGSLDYDFMTSGVRNATFKGSQSEQNLMRMNGILEYVFEKEPWPEVEWKSSRKDEDIAVELAGTGEKSQPVVLLDEVEKSLDVRWGPRLWHTFASKNIQVIAATHDPWGLAEPGVNVIELTDGWVDEIAYWYHRLGKVLAKRFELS